MKECVSSSPFHFADLHKDSFITISRKMVIPLFHHFPNRDHKQKKLLHLSCFWLSLIHPSVRSLYKMSSPSLNLPYPLCLIYGLESSTTVTYSLMESFAHEIIKKKTLCKKSLAKLMKRQLIYKAKSAFD